MHFNTSVPFIPMYDYLLLRQIVWSHFVGSINFEDVIMELDVLMVTFRDLMRQRKSFSISLVDKAAIITKTK